MDQCSGITKKGTQCKNKIKKDTQKCHLHNDKPVKSTKKQNCQAYNCSKKANHSNKNGSYCKKHVDQYKLDKPEECPICMNDLLEEKEPLSCGHWVHKNCILEWKDQCPVCRSKIKLSKSERQKLRNQNQTEDEEDVHQINYREFLIYLDFLRNTDINEFLNYTRDLGMITDLEGFDLLLIEQGL
jgi:hypothetical protein